MSSANGGSDSKPVVLVERTGAVASVVLNDPPHNRLSMAMVDRLEELIPELAGERGVRAVVITGAGDRTFSVGADIREFGEVAAKMGMRAFIEQRLRVLAAIESLPKPVVCAIRGPCVGGGLELALSCHFRIAAEGARIGLPEVELGIAPAWGGTQRLTRTVGRAHALDMMLRARRIGAEEAHRIGLVHQVCTPDELLDRAHGLAEELSEQAPLAVAGILEAVIVGGELSLEEGLAVEYRAVERTSGSADTIEGVRAFFEKRKPVFKGE
jgi:enoyl-CoA hydratase